MKRSFLTFACAALFMLATSLAVAAESAPTAAKPASPKHTRLELLSRIKGTLDREDEIFSLMPELRVENIGGGPAIYKYRGIELKDLDDDTLQKLYNRIQNEALKIRTDRTNRQLETIRQAQQANMAAQQASRIPRVVTPPAPPPVIPAPPPAPSSTQNIPRVPQVPPSPPRR